MRNFAIILFLFFQSFACLQGQVDIDQRLDFAVSELSISKTLLELSRAAEISILFQSELMDPELNVNINETNRSLRELLNICLAETRLTFRIEDGQIIIYRKISPKITLSGYIEDAESGERLVAAIILDVRSGTGTATNDYGYFSISVPSGEVEVVSNYIGYEGISRIITLQKDSAMVLQMTPYLTTSEVVIVDQEIRAGDRRYQIGRGHIVIPEDLNSIPALGGEKDVYRYLQTQTGVTGGADGLGGLHVRGGNAEHNLVLLDGVPVFNPSHALGLFSVFNDNAIRSVRFIKEGFSAQYGGRLSSVVDVRTREGNAQRTTGSLEIGTLATKGLIEIPIVKNKSALLLSGRRTHLDPFIRSYSRRKKTENIDEGEANYFFYDFNGKFHSELGDRDKIYLSYYQGADDFGDFTTWESIYEDDNGTEFYQSSYQDQELFWSNRIGSLRWNHIFGDQLFLNTTLTYSRYNYSSFNEYEYFDEGEISEPYFSEISTNRSQVEDYGISLDFNKYTSGAHRWNFGFGALRRNFVPAALQIESEVDSISVEDAFTTIDSSETFVNYQATEFNAYVEDIITIGERSTLQVGLRSAAFRAINKTYISLQPRLSLTFPMMDNASGRFSIAKTTQFLHVLSSSDAGLPTDLWVPSTDDIGPQHAWQYSIGSSVFWKSGWTLDLGLYYKTMTGLLSYEEETKQPGLVETDPEYWEELVTTGKGTAYGFEVGLNKTVGKTTGAINYTYSNATRQFDAFNNGRQFPFSFERPHDLNIQLSHQLANQITLQLGWYYASGRPQTLQEIEGRFVALSNLFGFVEQLSDINDFRLPAYHRLDLNCRMDFNKGKTWHQINLGVYNAYNKTNPYYQYVLADSGDVDQQNALPLMPSVSYKVLFGKGD